MKCAICGFDNEAREAYCRACGSKVQVNLSEVESDLIAKSDRQMEESTEGEIRRWLVASICLFLVVLTAKVLFGPATWPPNYAVPSIGRDADYATYTYVHDVPLQPVQVEMPPP
ncbi:MAG: hypothetical protein FD180_5030 [Planctomycetota bacterium]|nr:MAG: hypothetical protein FD180_5030 [Planctomycetota bacterium]